MTAKRLYQEGFAKWRLVFDAFPKAIDNDVSTGDDMIDFVKQYRDVLDQLDETIGDDFPLWDAIEQFDKEQVFKEELAAHKERMGGAKSKTDATKSDAAKTESPKPGATSTPAKKPADNAKAAPAVKKP